MRAQREHPTDLTQKQAARAKHALVRGETEGLSGRETRLELGKAQNTQAESDFEAGWTKQHLVLGQSARRAQRVQPLRRQAGQQKVFLD